MGGEFKGVNTFPKGSNMKVNIIAWLEFELTDFDVWYNAMGIPPREIEKERKNIGKEYWIRKICCKRKKE